MGRPINLEFQEVPECSACGQTGCASAERAAAYGQIITYVCCTNCGLVRMNPRPTGAGMDRFYSHFYMSPDGRDVAANCEKQRSFARFLVYVLATNVRLDRIVRILDVGCGFGATLETIRAAVERYHSEVALFGIEPSEDARRIAQETAGVELIGRHAQDLAGCNVKFDLIILSHVLEHMTDPVDVLKLLATKLSPDGHILLEVPNYYGHQSVDLGHNFLFTPTSLTNVCRAAGVAPVVLYATDHVSEDRPFYLTALLRGSNGAASVPERESVEMVVRERSNALRRWSSARPRMSKVDRVRLAFARLTRF
jgi:2-polyprenyl-3-methyl-5-hydroxy-6-metoxy-1,4-benzoquinol methylase